MTTQNLARPKMNDDSKVVSYSARAADVLRFDFERVGWAIWMIDEHSGCVYVQSDWGDASYRWHTGSLGSPPTLKDFLARAGPEYICDKMCGNGERGPFADCFDGKATLAALKKELLELEHTNDGCLSCDECCNDLAPVNGVWPVCLLKDYCNECAEELLKRFCDEGRNHSREGGWVWSLAPEALHKALSNEGWESLVYVEHPWKVPHRTKLIPVLKEKLAELGYGSKARLNLPDNERDILRTVELQLIERGVPIDKRVAR